MNFYNEFDPEAAAWLRELIARKLIPDGVVDERSITEIQPHELTQYTQCHFFAGIGGWSLALEIAGVGADEPLWTGSCPCQPYSGAGKGLGDDDPRNLWPAFFALIRECKPKLVFGEQVADAIRKGWLDGISADLESEGYACGSVVLGAHSVASPHIRKRLYWVADANWQTRGVSRVSREGIEPSPLGRDSELVDCGDLGGMADGIGEGLERQSRNGDGRDESGREPTGPARPVAARCPTCGHLADTSREGLQGGERQGASGAQGQSDGHVTECGGDTGRLGDADGDRREAGSKTSEATGHGDSTHATDFWSDSRWIECRDGKYRRIPTEPALFPLADGLPYKLARRGSVRPALLKGAGNAIVPQVAAAFIKAFNSLNQ